MYLLEGFVIYWLQIVPDNTPFKIFINKSLFINNDNWRDIYFSKFHYTKIFRSL